MDINVFDDYLLGDNSPLTREVCPIDIDDLTQKRIDGSGVFDTLMSSVYAHLKGEFDKNRITGTEYTKAYIALTELAMGSAVQFVLQKDQTYWQAINAQLEGINARMQVELTQQQILLSQAELQIKQQQILLSQAELQIKQQELLNKQQELLLLQQQVVLVKEQAESQRAQTLGTRSDGTAVSGLIGKQVNLYQQQLVLVKEQAESQRAQTLDTRSDSAAVSGLIKTQKDLYKQQIDSYKRDAETKLGKLLIDTWTTQKTVDEGLTAPTQVSNANLDTLIAALRSRNTI
ncbi:MAG: hypothetical protein LC106_08110 [Burkholderiales bacterium]|nr:hypothetical protein [Burkholderiales bacterium]